MGMNIYTLKGKHLGKRSAAGVWCWDCKVQCESHKVFFCKKHKTKLELETDWYARKCSKCQERVSENDLADDKLPPWATSKVKFICPDCGKGKMSDKIGYNPVFRELGFDKSKPKVKRGIDGASGWGWCTDEETGLATSKEEIVKKLRRYKEVETEYGDKWTMKKFWAMFKDVLPETESNYEFS
jgi:hypothetical protein